MVDEMFTFLRVGVLKYILIVWLIYTMKNLGTWDRNIFSHLYLEVEQFLRSLIIKTILKYLVNCYCGPVLGNGDTTVNEWETNPYLLFGSYTVYKNKHISK